MNQTPRCSITVDLYFRILNDTVHHRINREVTLDIANSLWIQKSGRIHFRLSITAQPFSLLQRHILTPPESVPQSAATPAISKGRPGIPDDVHISFLYIYGRTPNIHSSWIYYIWRRPALWKKILCMVFEVCNLSHVRMIQFKINMLKG